VQIRLTHIVRSNITFKAILRRQPDSTMARCLILFAFMLATIVGHGSARNLFQADKAPECKPAVVKTFSKPLCLAQYMRSNPEDPKTAAVVTPTTVALILASADSACGILGLGGAVDDGVEFGTTSEKNCFNGKSTTEGPAWKVLTCCQAGVTLARAQDARYSSYARMQDARYSSYARLQDARYSGYAKERPQSP
jgi:hypothetical protein